MSATPPLNRVRAFDHVLSADPHNPEAALQAVREFEKSTAMVPKAVIPITEMTLETALCIANAYNVPFLSRETVEAARDKLKMKQMFSEAEYQRLNTSLFRMLVSYRPLPNCWGIQLLSSLRARHTVSAFAGSIDQKILRRGMSTAGVVWSPSRPSGELSRGYFR